jgi:hypothetical protein
MQPSLDYERLVGRAKFPVSQGGDPVQLRLRRQPVPRDRAARRPLRHDLGKPLPPSLAAAEEARRIAVVRRILE